MTSPHHPSDPEPFTAESIRHNLNTSFMGSDLLFYETLPTTMDVADMKAMAGASEGTVILADDQTAGRGRFDRQWVVEKGAAIAVSIILRPPPSVSARLHIVCSLAVARAAETAAGLKPAIKWPNDVLLDGKKTSGILLTSNRDRDGKLYVNAGIGINVNQTAESLSEITPPATSLRVQAGKPVSRLEVFCALLHHLESSISKPSPAAICSTCGAPISSLSANTFVYNGAERTCSVSWRKDAPKTSTNSVACYSAPPKAS